MLKLSIVNIFFLLALSTFFYLSSVGFSAPDPVLPENQEEFEKASELVVRDKLYYKSGKLEFAGSAGLMPYDDINNQYFVGAKGTWHLSDYWGWEVLDFQKAFVSATDWVRNLVDSKSINNLQTAQLNYLATSNIVFSPFYGKVRVFGSSLVYYDLYAVLGGGLAGTRTVKLSKGNPEVELKSGMDPVIDFGVGFKCFLGPSFGLLLDLRDYLTFSEVYGKRSIKSNYTVFLGLNFFIPSF